MMKQAEITGANAPLKIVEVPIHEAPAKGLVIKTAYGGVCHTDLGFIKDKLDLGDGKAAYHSKNLAAMGKSFEGVVLGHEISGTVFKFGAEAKADEYGLKEGDRVSVFPWLGCGDCPACDTDFSNCCDDKRNGVEGGYGLHWLGLSPNGGGYQEYVKVPDCKFAIKLPDSIPLDVGCMLPCSGITAYGAVTKARPYVEIAIKKKGAARVLVTGAGGVGLWGVGLAKAIFADKPVKVLVADISQDKLDTARESGADDVILLDKDDDVEALATKIKAGGKMDAVLDFVGSELTSKSALESLNHLGTYVVVGLAGGALRHPLPGMIVKQLAAQGTLTGNLQEFKELIELCAKTEVKAPYFENYKLDQCNEVLDRLRARDIKGRALFKYE